MPGERPAAAASARLRYGLLYATLFFELGVNLPFFPLWLRAQSLDPREIGIVLATPFLVRILANPLAAAFADRRGRIASTLVACAVAVAAGTAVLAVVDGFAAILLTVTAIALAQGPLIAIADALTLGALAREPRAELVYGRIRLWGSASFAAANLIAGWTVGRLDASAVVVLLLVSALAVAVATASVARLAPTVPAPAAPAAPRSRIERPWLIALVIAGAGLIQASHAAAYAFSTLHWEEEGLSGLAIGSLWALGVVSEIAVFAFAGRLAIGVRGALVLVAAGGLVASLRWIGMAADPPPLVVAALQLGHGLSFGATHLGSVFLLARLAPPSLGAQVQAWLAAVWAGSMAALTALGGALYADLGQHVYWPMAAAAAVGLSAIAAVAVGLAREAPRPAARKLGWWAQS